MFIIEGFSDSVLCWRTDYSWNLKFLTFEATYSLANIIQRGQGDRFIGQLLCAYVHYCLVTTVTLRDRFSFSPHFVVKNFKVFKNHTLNTHIYLTTEILPLVFYYTIDSWTTWIITVRIHLYMDFFLICKQNKNKPSICPGFIFLDLTNHGLKTVFLIHGCGELAECIVLCHFL